MNCVGVCILTPQITNGRTGVVCVCVLEERRVTRTVVFAKQKEKSTGIASNCGTRITLRRLYDASATTSNLAQVERETLRKFCGVSRVVWTHAAVEASSWRNHAHVVFHRLDFVIYN